jgi:oxygen-independent coproporphyrinogen-3 oxidase
MQLDVINEPAETESGSYFVANYPPFSAWSRSEVGVATGLLAKPAPADPPPLGLYLHIPFCRKRCKFCYFRVYTDKNSSEVEEYLQALTREISLYAQMPYLQGRQFEFVYFGGGTPSFLSSEQLQRLIEDINQYWQWNAAREVTFECEPGTLKKSKLQAIRAIGVTRLSLGVEHFDDEVLSVNGRAHKSPEIFRSYQWARDVGFDQINIDLIAGMAGDTDDKWKDAVDNALEMSPDCLTIYQMEMPFNSEFSKRTREQGLPSPFADWATKRRWVDYAFQLFEQNGYVVSSAYTLVKPTGDERSQFVYRDALWRGGDMVGTGVASFSHVGGVHFQNEDQWGPYVERVNRGELPISRAMTVSDHQRFIREFILQCKLGRVDMAYFKRKFGVDVPVRFSEELHALRNQGLADLAGPELVFTRTGLLRVDALLPLFFEPQFRNGSAK